MAALPRQNERGALIHPFEIASSLMIVGDIPLSFRSHNEMCKFPERISFLH
jgi:hypothetical protein